jgi:hypothetical protein
VKIEATALTIGPIKVDPLVVKLETKPTPAAKEKPGFLAAPQMLKYGSAVGVAAAFHAPTKLGDDPADQTNLGVSAMPYVAVIPFYWRL